MSTPCCALSELYSLDSQPELFQFGQILASICDPYMNYFRGIRFLRIGNMDFSPVLSIGLR